MSPIPVFRNQLKKAGLHIDFLRLRCGAEETFHEGVRKVGGSAREAPHVFVSFAEWDAVVVLPCERLYPQSLNDLYGMRDVVTSISGNAGYFSYLWDHPINDRLTEKLASFAAGGIAVLISLRFEDWLRSKLGLAAEMLVSDALNEKLGEAKNEGIQAVIAHTLGWNDVAILLHASKNERRLTQVLSWLRILTLGPIINDATTAISEDEKKLPMFAASYTHLIGSYEQFRNKELSLGELDKEIVAAKLLVRVPASFEPEVREVIGRRLFPGAEAATLQSKMPSEMGHYSFSADLTDMATRGGAREVLQLVREARTEIGRLGSGTGGSYAETSTIFTFPEPQEGIETLVKPKMADDIRKDIDDMVAVLDRLPKDLEIRGASPMTIHRFSTVLVTLIDHLSDPVRSAAVRHAATFMGSLPDRIGGLSREAIDDLCHVCESAMAQAIDGIAQFQHDANSIGLSGRGGYSRLIVAIEMLARDIFSALHIKEQPPLITFGLRTGTPGSLDRFQIDIPFRVVFTPSDWYILLHEVGHHCWIQSFSWMTESVATYEALSREIMLNRREANLPEDANRADKATRAEFLQARSIVRELFPSLLVHRLGCGGDDLKRFDDLSMHHVLRTSGKNDGTRSMVIAVVLHCLLEVIGSRELQSADTPTGGPIERAREWWRGWQQLHDQLRAAGAVQAEAHLQHHAQRAIDSVSETLEILAGSATPQISVIDKQKILNSGAFLKAVVDALTSVIAVLASSTEQFGVEDTPGSRLFHDVQEAIDQAVAEQEEYESWQGAFGEWLADGEVFALVPRAHVWLRLLMDAEQDLHPRSSAKFMVSQLSIVLSMWHRAVTGRPSGREAPDRLRDVIEPLGYIETLPREVSMRS